MCETMRVLSVRARARLVLFAHGLRTSRLQGREGMDVKNQSVHLCLQGCDTDLAGGTHALCVQAVLTPQERWAGPASRVSANSRPFPQVPVALSSAWPWVKWLQTFQKAGHPRTQGRGRSFRGNPALPPPPTPLSWTPALSRLVLSASCLRWGTPWWQ